MKKLYIKPETEIVEIKVQQMLASSPIPTDSTPTDPSESDAPQFTWQNTSTLGGLTSPEGFTKKIIHY